jgi:hypothetical protein
MSRDTRKPGDGQDGVRVIENRGRRPVVAVLAVVTLAAIATVHLLRQPGKQAAPDASVPLVADPVARQPVVSHPARPQHKPPAASVDEVATASRRVPISERVVDRAPANPERDGVQDPAPNPAATEDEGSQFESLARDLIERLRASGETGGIAVFPPPGTNPVRTGIVVPDEFELPEGYVRYYQITDDGRRLEPILMFSPDYDFVGPDGQPIAVPKDGIVPPDMAPPGLPVRMLEVPGAPRASAAGSPGDGP